MKRLIKVILMVILLNIFLLLNFSVVFAKNDMSVKLDKYDIQKGEEVKARINITDTSVAALTLEIYFNPTKLEFVKGINNSNFVNNRIIYTWVNGNGRGLNELDIGDFVFKAIEDGTANIIATGEFYMESGEKINIEPQNAEVLIGQNKGQEEIVEEIGDNEENVSSNNTNLKVMRLNHEGISPEFNKDIKEYYFVTDSSINSLDVTALPENKNAKVTVTGNKNLKMGLNTVNIEVEAEDGKNKSNYKIYVTKTDNLEKANANLENLAIRQGTLEPEFHENMTRYKVEVANDVEQLDILAIPERINSRVSIKKENKLDIGDNKISVIVIAEDGITKKKYEIIAHRRTEKEEMEKQKEDELQVERLSAILGQQEKEEEKEKDNKVGSDFQKDTNTLIWSVVGITIGVIIIIIFVLIIMKNKRKLNKNK